MPIGAIGRSTIMPRHACIVLQLDDFGDELDAEDTISSWDSELAAEAAWKASLASGDKVAAEDEPVDAFSGLPPSLRQLVGPRTASQPNAAADTSGSSDTLSTEEVMSSLKLMMSAVARLEEKVDMLTAVSRLERKVDALSSSFDQFTSPTSSLPTSPSMPPPPSALPAPTPKPAVAKAVAVARRPTVSERARTRVESASHKTMFSKDWDGDRGDEEVKTEWDGDVREEAFFDVDMETADLPDWRDVRAAKAAAAEASAVEASMAKVPPTPPIND